MKTETMIPRTLFAVLFALASAGVLAQGAARVQTATGVVSVERQGVAPGLLSVGEDVHPGDVLRTERDSSARLRFTDGTEVAVRPGTHIAIEGYSYEVAKPEADNFAIRLLKGGMRTVTGLLGKRRPETFSVRAVTATVGIRGTDFIVRICEEDCAAENATRPRPVAEGGLMRASFNPDDEAFEVAQAPDDEDRTFSSPGIYVVVRDGSVEFRKDGGLVVLQRGDAGYSDILDGLPRLFNRTPFFLERDAYLVRLFSRVGGSAVGGLMCTPSFGT